MFVPICNYVPLFFLHRERSAAANRMSHIFGLSGPTSTAETACWEPRAVPRAVPRVVPSCPRFIVSGGSGYCADDHEAMQNFNGRSPNDENHVIMIFHVFANVNHQ